jgi:hypothetical protein
MTATAMTVLPREMRLVIERILLLTTLPPGMVPAVRDVVLYSAAAGHGGLPLLQRRFAALREADTAGLRIEAESAEGAGQHVWVVLPLLLDALGEAVARTGRGRLTVAHVQDEAELRTACALGPRSGLNIRFEAPATLLATVATEEDTVMADMLRHGVLVDPALWWDLHHLSNTSLSLDTPLSRRHAGPVIVESDGRIIGRSDHDDDTDLSLLTESRPNEVA